MKNLKNIAKAAFLVSVATIGTAASAILAKHGKELINNSLKEILKGYS